MNIYLTHTSAQKDLLAGTRRSLDTNDGGVIVSGRGGDQGEADHSNAENRKYENHRLFFFYRLALVRPVTIATEFPLAERQQSVATETVEAGLPNDR